MIFADLLPPLSCRRWCATASTPTSLPRRWCPSSLRKSRAVQLFVGLAKRCRSQRMRGTFVSFSAVFHTVMPCFPLFRGVTLDMWLQLTGHRSERAELCGCWKKPRLKPNTDYCENTWTGFSPANTVTQFLQQAPEQLLDRPKQRSICDELQRSVSKRKCIGLAVCVDFTNDTNPVVRMTEVMMPVR